MDHKQHLGIQVVELLITYERALQRYYETLVSYCTEGQDFFRRMADAEAGHARMIEQLADQVRAGEVRFRVSVMTTGQIECSLKTIDEAIRHTREHGLTYVAALAKALAMEKTLAEDRFYEVFEADSAVTRHLKETMSRSIAHHVAMVDSALKNALGRQGPPPPRLCATE